MIGNVMNDYGIRADDDIVTHAYTPEDLGTGTALYTVTDSGRAEWIINTGIAGGNPVTDHTVIADDGRTVDDDAAMMFDAQPAADGCARVDADSAKDLDQLVEHHVSDRPGCTHDPVPDDEARVAEAVHQQRPETEAQQTFPLCLEIFQNQHPTPQEQRFNKLCAIKHTPARRPRGCQLRQTPAFYAIVPGTATAGRGYNKVKQAG
jgi:hypothetical protein